MSVRLLHRLFATGYSFIAVLFAIGGLTLTVLAAIQLWNAANPTNGEDLPGRVLQVLDTIATLTVAVAALELGQTTVEERVVREAHVSAPTRVRRFVSRFMAVTVVSLTIEALVLVFQFGHDDSTGLVAASVVGLTAAGILAAWGVFVKLNRSAEELEPEAIEEARHEDDKVSR